MKTRHINPQRRSLLYAASASVAGLAVGPALAASGGAKVAQDDPWARAQRIIDGFREPLAFPKRDFPITAYGAEPCEAVMVDGYVAHHQQGRLSTPAPGC